ncbi:TPA: hypothetical protein N0F65_008077, partial [Lagenidium giganteum]
CDCFAGYTSYDCSDRQCPFAAPWFDYAHANDDIRSVPRECSNRGICDRGSGRCQCQRAFSGVACERLNLCVNNCNGHGKCRSMRDIGPLRNDVNLFYTATYTLWDADRVLGCVCDDGYYGVDCSLRQCPYGDDPITTGQVDEVQALSCLCGSCTGTYTLTFRGQTTRALDVASETAATLKAALDDLSTIRSVTVTLDGGTTVCSNTGVSALITFTHEHGDVPSLIVTSSVTGGTSSIAVQADGATATYGTNAATQTGTKEVSVSVTLKRSPLMLILTICGSGCRAQTAECATRTTESARVSRGSRRATVSTQSGLTYVCSSRGPCSQAPLYQCQCDSIYGAYDCSKRRCPKGRPWFDEAKTNDVARVDPVQCSNAGYCDDIGICRCFDGFEGVACDRLQCPGSDIGLCSGRGRCKTAKEIARLTLTDAFTPAGLQYGVDPNNPATWDADMVQGCYCDKVPARRGTGERYTGYDCSSAPCPSGDDPWTGNQADEVQTLTCTADGGMFAISFRAETTAMIPFGATADAVAAALEALQS